MIPIILATDQDSLRKKVRGREDLSGVEVAIPIHRGDATPRMRHKLVDRYIATPFEYMSDQRALKEVRRVIDDELLLPILKAPKNQRWEIWRNIDEDLIGGRTGRWKIFNLPWPYEGEKLWSLMLIDWVFQVRPEKYLKGKQHLADAFADYLGITYPRGGYGAMFREHVVFKRATIRPDRRIMLAMKEREREMFEVLTKVPGYYEHFGQASMILAGLLTGFTEVWVLTVLLEALIGYLSFLADLWEFEKDGIITEDELGNAWISLIFIFLPMGAFLGKVGKVATTILMIGFTLLSLLYAIAVAIIELLERLPRLIAAVNAGIEDIADIDPEKTVYIPYQRR